MIIINAIVVSIVAAAVRVMFYPSEKYWRAVANFFGGVIFGSLAGYIANGIGFHKYVEVIAALAALTGKEIVETLRQAIPLAIKFVTSIKFKT